jgi:N-acetylmuramoyl-L-alanine amidase
MISIFSRKRSDLKMKQDILRGIYEENLRIIGKGDGVVSRQKPFVLNKFFLTLVISTVAILVHGSYVSNSFFSEKQLTAGEIRQKILPPNLRSNPADFRAFITNPDMSVSRTFGLGVRTIMIDAGHGGADSGTKGIMGTLEKDITLDIAKRLKDRLDKYGRYHVLMTRDQDVTLPLNKRVGLAMSMKTDLFISIHLNYLPHKPINIIETYYFGPSSDTGTQRLAEQENAGSQYGLSDFKEIIEKLGERLKTQESRGLAYSIQKKLFLNFKKDNGNAYDFGVKRAPFVVLLGVDIPAVLAEVSCLSNKEEERLLNTPGHRENIAHYLEAGILDYLNKGELSYEASGFAEKR